MLQMLVHSTPKNMCGKLINSNMDVIQSMKDSTIRADKKTQKGSAIDTIRMVLGCDSSNANTSLGRLVLAHPELGARCTRLKVNNKGHPTPVADAKTLIEIVWLLPGKKESIFNLVAFGRGHA